MEFWKNFLLSLFVFFSAVVFKIFDAEEIVQVILVLKMEIVLSSI